MLKRIKNLLEHNAYAISIILTCFITYSSLVSIADLNVEITVSDKFLHTLAYLLLTYSWLFAIVKSHSNFKIKVQVGLVVFLFGILIEVLQSSLTIYRQGDYLDILANTLGIILAIVTFNSLFRIYKTI